jgi:hypothetical protein
MQKIKAELDTLIEIFDLKFVKNPITFSNFIQDIDVDKLEDIAEQILTKIETNLSLEIDGWFEEELKMKLLSPILFLADLAELKKIGVFFERPISAEFEQGKISVITDCMVSSVYGFTTPEKPYFFMQEFKKSKGDKQDPEGQMLAAMIAGQKQNNNGKVMYGSFVVGAFWYFTVLEGKNYSRSDAFQLTKPVELRQVILTLRKLKQIILTELMD